jgi:uncharacterized oligopeptide transporter (OPT) family protein
MKVRIIGAGTIGIAAVYTLLRVIGPIVKGITAMAAQRKRKAGEGDSLALTEQDLPIGIVGAVIVAAMVPIGLLLASFAQGGPIEAHFGPVLIATIAYVLVIGVVIASVCGYMAGLIGASNSPVSGTGIISALGISLLLAAFSGGHRAGGDPRAGGFRVVRHGHRLWRGHHFERQPARPEDRRTGRRDPWRQQVALVLGVVFGALVIPPVLSLLNHTFGFVGAPGNPATALAAPQASLISTLAEGVLGGKLDWGLIDWRGDWRGGHRDRRNAAQGEARPCAAGAGHGDLSAMALTLFIRWARCLAISMIAGRARRAIRNWPSVWACWRPPG